MNPQIDTLCGKIAYLGLNSHTAKHYSADHIPVIKIVPYAKSSPQIRRAIHYVKYSSHAILTSPSSTSLFFATMRKQRYLNNLHYLCVGKVTAKRLLHFLPQARYSLAATETGEGILPLVASLPHTARILYPHSSLSRPVITDFLIKENKQFVSYPHYTVKPLSPRPSCFTPYKHIIFTSPSGVRAYAQLFPCLPQKMYWCLGPITLKEFQKTSNIKANLLPNI
ncbi:uroporphyrinogen-III synthase [Chlamydia gallinacea]|uniref:uroporphyrinogen-III synthase n=1 Tax=Chlamydia gallinacea TaxID=1457153 RepID=UPI0024E1E461|nr:uroporphyrinogen-III synthase [Chlamydia gallinacea]